MNGRGGVMWKPPTAVGVVVHHAIATVKCGLSYVSAPTFIKLEP